MFLKITSTDNALIGLGCKEIIKLSYIHPEMFHPAWPGFQSGNESLFFRRFACLFPPLYRRPRFANIKKTNRLRERDLLYTAQANLNIDAQIGREDHLQMQI
ncbi:hypothetical protein TRIP_B350217 [uncultured Desulfatiglans sp.]|nr:hypothetical protein TRIP_B350217 [uncultured Desulfatiglans sp.]